MNTPSIDLPPCSITECTNTADYLCVGHECVPGLVNTPQLCRDCYLALHGLVRTAFLGVNTQTCPGCGEVFAEPDDVLRVVPQQFQQPAE